MALQRRAFRGREEEDTGGLQELQLPCGDSLKWPVHWQLPQWFLRGGLRMDMFLWDNFGKPQVTFWRLTFCISAWDTERVTVKRWCLDLYGLYRLRGWWHLGSVVSFTKGSSHQYHPSGGSKLSDAVMTGICKTNSRPGGKLFAINIIHPTSFQPLLLE